jgi:hypothetical protein
MSSSLAIARQPGRIALLRQRESATEAMIRHIDEKLARLGSARRDRLLALNRIRCEIARALLGEPAAPDYHGNLD